MSRRFECTISFDNFQSQLLSFLRATSTIHDNEEASLISWRRLPSGEIRLKVETTTEKQLAFPFTDPLGR